MLALRPANLLEKATRQISHPLLWPEREVVGMQHVDVGRILGLDARACFEARNGCGYSPSGLTLSLTCPNPHNSDVYWCF